MSNKFKFRIFSIFSIIVLCIGCTIKEFQNDTFYIIKLGNYIVNNGIDFKDHWCWITQLNYTYPHWLYDVFMYFIYNYFSYFGIYVSTIILFIILILLICYINIKINKNELMAFFVSILSIAALFNFATARAQLPSAILLLLEVYFIEKLMINGNKKYIFYLCLISLAIANIHATIWLVYFIFYLPYIGEYIIYKIKRSKFLYNVKKNGIKFGLNSSSNKIIVENINNIKKIIVSFVLGFLMGIFSPSRICYTYVFKIMMGDSQDYIVEHAPLVLLHQPIFLFLIVIVILILSFTKVKIKLRELFMIFGLAFMCMTAVRHVALFVIIGMIFISRICCRFFELEKDETFNILYMKIVKNNLLYIFLFILVVCVSANQFYKNFKDDYISVKEYPVKAVSYIKNELDYENIRLYNEYNVGSYLMFNDIPVFVDSRCDLYLSEFNGLKYSIFDDEMNIEYNYKKKFKFYDVTHALVSNNDIFYRILSVDNNYNIIYEDKHFTLFERVGNYEKN